MLEWHAPPAILKTHVLPSRSHVDIDVADVLVDGRIAVYPHVINNADLLSISFVRDKIRLSAGKYIGLIPLTPSIIVDVRPKLPISNLAHVMDVAAHPVGIIAGVERTYLEIDLVSDSVTDFLMANYLSSLQKIIVSGWLKAYVQHTETTSHPRGRIDLSGTLASCWSRGLGHQVRSKSYQQTLNVPVNRLLRHVLEMMLLSRSGDGASESLMARANTTFNEFPLSIQRLRASDWSKCEAMCEQRALPTTRDYYYRALQIALLVMAARGVSLETQGEDVTLDTSIIDFETLFESYVLRVLKRHSGNSVIVMDGNKEGKRPLYDTQKDPPAQPDVVVLSAMGGAPVIADVKYKDKPKREDVNQVVTYAVAYRASRVLLIHQNKPGARRGLQLRGKIAQIEVYDYAIDLDAVDLLEEESKMAKSVFKLLR